MPADPFDSLLRPPTPRAPRPQFAAALRRRLEEELDMTTTTDVHLPAMFHIRVPDADRAMAFFGAVLDWEGERVEWDGYVRHYMLNTQRIQPVITSEPGDWDVRIGFKVDDVAAAADTVVRLGGTISDRGDYWILGTDDQGTELTLWRPGRPHDHSAATKPGAEIEWFEVYVPSPERGRAFYGELVGWRFGSGPLADHVLDAAGESVAALNGVAETGTVIYAHTGDIEASRARVIAAGGQADPSTSMGPGTGCYCRDDQGTRFGLWQPA